MEAITEIDTRRLEGWTREISRMRRRSLGFLVAILAGLAVVAVYAVVNHCRTEIVFFLAALAFLVVANMSEQVRVMRFVEKDIFSHVLLSRTGASKVDVRSFVHGQQDDVSPDSTR